MVEQFQLISINKQAQWLAVAVVSQGASGEGGLTLYIYTGLNRQAA